MDEQAFAIADDGVDPGSVPQRVLCDGTEIPAIGLGTFGSDRFSPEQIAAVVIGAASVGYRHFDCASVYGIEELIGRSLRRIIEGGLGRGELWITSKLWNDKHVPDDVIASCEKSLADLQLDYLDLYLTHWLSRTTTRPDATWALAAPTPNRISRSNRSTETGASSKARYSSGRRGKPGRISGT